MFKIGQLARRLGLNVRTLRYYDSIGLLPPAARTEGGYRVYSERDEKLLRFVLQAKKAGFTLEEIQQIIQLGQVGSPCCFVRETVSNRIKEMDAQITSLTKLRGELASALNAGYESSASFERTICGLIEHGFPSAPTTNEEKMMTKRKVEVFTADCPVCDPVVKMVQRLACDDCDVTIHNLNNDPQAATRAEQAGVSRVPMVLVDGQPAECCQSGPVTEEGLRAAGIGAGS